MLVFDQTVTYKTYNSVTSFQYIDLKTQKASIIYYSALAGNVDP